MGYYFKAVNDAKREYVRLFKGSAELLWYAASRLWPNEPFRLIGETFPSQTEWHLIDAEPWDDNAAEKLAPGWDGEKPWIDRTPRRCLVCGYSKCRRPEHPPFKQDPT